MAKDPAMLFYTADFLIGVAFMSMEERGQYITLLCYQQQRGHLTLDEMEKAVGTLTAEVLDKFVQDDEGKYYNRRAEVEIAKRQNYTNSRLKNFSHTENHMSDHMEKHMESHMENENEIDNNEIDNAKRDKRGVGEEEEKAKPEKHKYGEYKNVLLTDEELEKLKEEYPDYLTRVENLSEYIASKGVSYKSHYATIRAWARKDAEKNLSKTEKKEPLKKTIDTQAYVDLSWQLFKDGFNDDDENSN